MPPDSINLKDFYQEKFQYAPFPWMGGKRNITEDVWKRLGNPLQYIEPFCGSAAMLLACPNPGSLEVICDMNMYVANFWRCIKFQPDAVYEWQDYPVIHVDLAARHRWLTDYKRTQELLEKMSDPEWPGDAQIAGWWVWGQCCWIGSGWCEKSQIPHIGDAGMGVQSKIPHIGNAGMGVQYWFKNLSQRLERVRVINGDWTRCLNNHYGGENTAVFLDPPYKNFERLYHKDASKHLIADDVAEWCKGNQNGMRIALCGLVGDYDLPGWEVLEWDRKRLTYGGSSNGEDETIWFSPPCAEIEHATQERLL